MSNITRDLAVDQVNAIGTLLGLLRNIISHEPDSECALATVDDVFDKLVRLVEYLHGDIGEQMHRYLEDPIRSDLLTAAKSAGVGGSIYKVVGGPTDLSKIGFEYRVVRINESSVRLGRQGVEKLHRLGTRDTRDNWTVTAI